jgi:putative effector of murein hydrolase
MGLTAHGIGTARAFQVSEEMGAFSGLAMALATFTTAFILPWLVGVLGLL